MPNIMEALANIARQNASVPQGNHSLTAPTPTAAPAYSLPGAYSSVAAPAPTPAPAAVPQPGMPGFPGMPFLPTTQPAASPVNLPGGMPAMPFAFPPQPQPGQGLPGAVNTAAGWPGNPPAMPNANSDPRVQQQLVLIQTLIAQGLPVDKIAQVISVMGQANIGTTPATAPSVPPPQHIPQPTSSYAGPSGWEAPRPDGSRDQNGYRDPMRSPNRRSGRSRSRSPPRWDSQLRGSGRNGYDYGTNSPNGRRGGPDDWDRGRDARSSEYRQRSPVGRRGFSPVEEPPAEKWVEYDPTLANGNIKVYSRTLFVGGVTCSEQELRQIFGKFGKVQTCIVNKDKRHAFVKMYYRKDAVKAKEGMDEHRNADLPLRVSPPFHIYIVLGSKLTLSVYRLGGESDSVLVTAVTTKPGSA
jgi:protein NRD1